MRGGAKQGKDRGAESGLGVGGRGATAPLEVTCLGSGSDGNATLVRYGSTAVLVDCGFSPTDLTRRLGAASVVPGDLDAILVTHEHGDHCRGLEVFARRHGLPVLLSAGTARALGWGRRGQGTRPGFQVLQNGRPLWVGGLQVLPLPASHDAREPLAFRIDTADGTSLGYMTDTGTIPAETLEGLRGCSLLGIEANHCPDLLRTGPYPAFLKRRICSDHGHLSNQECAGVLTQIATPALQAVLALHLSKVNNRPPLATVVLAEALASVGLSSPVHAQGPQGGASLTAGAVVPTSPAPF